MKNFRILVVLVALVSYSVSLFAQQPELQYYRPWNQEGINIFEPSKTADQPEYEGFKIRIGGSFTQTFQSLDHENSTPSKPLYALGPGFNLAMANLNLDFQIEDGIRVALENYMSSRHHSEFWVKGGYIQIDKLPMFGSPDWYTKYVRVKIGHFQPNFGDQQFRRNDGGNNLFNPFTENYIMDAFTTEIGGEVYIFPADGFVGMIGMTSGFINGNVIKYPDTIPSNQVEETKKNPSIFFKLAYDKQFSDDFRFRLSGSYYTNSSIARNTLYAGDRTGSQYFGVMEDFGANLGDKFSSGRMNPNMRNSISTFMINPFIKYKGLELFGSFESASGRNYNEREDRQFTQIAGDIVYRFLANEQLYIAARFIQASGDWQGFTDASGATTEQSIQRIGFGAGWFPTKNMLLKGEFVMQDYKDYPDTSSLYEGSFSGFVIQAVIGF